VIPAHIQPRDRGRGDAPGRDDDEALEGGVDEDLWLRCGGCDAPVASPRDAFSPDGGPTVRAWMNPSGVVWEVLTVRRAPGLAAAGRPTAAFSWFAGTAWRVAHCRACGRHLGWRYDALGAAAPSRFWGIIRTHLA